MGKGRTCPECGFQRTTFIAFTPTELLEEMLREHPEDFPMDFDPIADAVDGAWECKECGYAFTALAPGLFESDRRKRKNKPYGTNIYLHSEGRRRFIGGFKSWVAFARALGVSTIKASSDGSITGNPDEVRQISKNLGKVYEVIDVYGSIRKEFEEFIVCDER